VDANSNSEEKRLRGEAGQGVEGVVKRGVEDEAESDGNEECEGKMGGEKVREGVVEGENVWECEIVGERAGVEGAGDIG
jgi:hypothetical protein